MDEPILDETRRHRDEYARQFNYDLDAIGADLRRKQAERGHRAVALEPKPATPTGATPRVDGVNAGAEATPANHPTGAGAASRGTTMNGSTWVRLGAIVGGAAVLAGTFGAHGLEGFAGSERLETFETGVRYQMYHAPALVLVGLATASFGRRRGLAIAGWLFLAGVVLFPGALYGYVLARGAADWLAMVAPIGGAALIAGWFALALGAGGVAKDRGEGRELG